MARTTASTASTHSKHIMHIKVYSDPYESGSEGSRGGGGTYFHSKVTGWAGWAPKTIFLGPASFSLAKQLNGGGGGGGQGEGRFKPLAKICHYA